MDRRRALGIGLVLVAGASFASGSIFATLSYRLGVGWLTLLQWRFVVGAGLAWLWVLSSPRRRAAARGMPAGQIGAALVLGVVYSGNAGTYYAGLESIPAALAGVLVYVYPVFVAILSLRFATRLDGRRPWIALGLAIVGVVLALGGLDLGRPVPAGGLLLVLASAAIYSVWIVASARLSGERQDRLGSEAPAADPTARDAAVTTAVMMTSTALMLALLGVATGRPIDPQIVPGAAWPWLLGIGFIASFVAIQALYGGARRIGAAQAALISTSEPLFIVGLAAILLGQTLAPIQLLGAGLILVAVVIAQTSPRSTPASRSIRGMEAEAEA